MLTLQQLIGHLNVSQDVLDATVTVVRRIVYEQTRALHFNPLLDAPIIFNLYPDLHPCEALPSGSKSRVRSFLQSTLRALTPKILAHKKQVEMIVSDNCSSDARS